MSKIYFRKKVLYAKKETVYGAGGAIIGANAIQTRNLTISPLEGDTLEFDIDRGNFGANLQSLVGVHVMVTCDVPMAGSGTAGTAPPWGLLMLGCGHEETLAAGVSASYSPVDDDPDSLVFRFERDKWLHSIVGVRGSVKATLDKRNYPWWQFSFMGLFVPPAKLTAALVPVFTPWKKPVPFRASTVSCTLAGEVVGLHTASFDFGQKVEFYEHSEEESIQITDRSASFQATFEETDFDTHDYFADIIGEVTGELEYVHGVTPGNIVTITSPLTQINKPSLQNQQGVTALQVTGRSSPTARMPTTPSPRPN